MSSYSRNNYGVLFEALLKQYRPLKIVEFGILDGYSLDVFIKNSLPESKIYAFDIFEEFIGNSSKERQIREKYEDFENVFIEKLDYYSSLEILKKLGKIDFLHIDVANDGDVFEFAIKNLLPFCKVLVLEGGSEERDNVEWMGKYNKKPINPILINLKLRTHSFFTVDYFPSVTIFHPFC